MIQPTSVANVLQRHCALQRSKNLRYPAGGKNIRPSHELSRFCYFCFRATTPLCNRQSQARRQQIRKALHTACPLRDTTMLEYTMATAPYKSTPIFDEITLPQKFRHAHNTKAGVWAVIRVLEGQVRYVIEEAGRRPF
jgi:hypothetical protein